MSQLFLDIDTQDNKLKINNVSKTKDSRKGSIVITVDEDNDLGKDLTTNEFLEYPDGYFKHLIDVRMGRNDSVLNIEFNVFKSLLLCNSKAVK